MAKLKPSGLIHITSGKINGQVISRYSHGVVVKNIVQPSHVGNSLQRKQRFETNTISQKWRGLSTDQKASYRYEAADYYKLDKMGFLQPRSGYGLFLFLSQNLILLNNIAPLFAPPFVLMTDPQAYLTERSSIALSIKSDIVVQEYQYALFADVNVSYGSQPSIKNEKLCGFVDASSLAIGLDVSNMIQQSFDYPINLLRTAVRLSAIDFETGNRNEDINWLNQTAKTTIVGQYATASAIVSHALANNGVSFITRRQNAPLRGYSTAPAFEIQNSILDYTTNLVPNGIYGMTFSEDGHHAYFQRQQTTPPFIRHYQLTVPWDMRTATFVDDLVFTIDGRMRGIYIATDGSFLISTNQFGTQKFSLSIPYMLASATLIDENPNYKSKDTRNYMFSNDGLIFIEFDLTKMASYRLTTPFDIQQLQNNLIKTIDINAYISPASTTSRYMSMTYTGLYFTISTYSSDPSQKDLTMFKLPSPFTLFDF